jgi:hypothetical protein
MNRIIADIRHCDTVLAAGGNIDSVIPRGGDCNHFQLGQLRERFLAQSHLIDNGHRGVLQMRHDLIVTSAVIFFISMFESRPAHLHLQ